MPSPTGVKRFAGGATVARIKVKKPVPRLRHGGENFVDSALQGDTMTIVDNRQSVFHIVEREEPGTRRRRAKSTNELLRIERRSRVGVRAH
jgi:hypothetical protein